MDKKVASGAAAAPPPEKPEVYGAASMTDLEPVISWGHSYVLNAAKPGVVDYALKQGMRDQEGLLIESDSDEQLLFSVAFNTAVKIHSLKICGPADGRAPKTVKLLVNPGGSIDFNDAEGMVADQELSLTPETLGERLELKFVKFQRVTQLAIFVESNQEDGEVSALSCIQLFGAERHTTNMNEFKRVAGEAGEGE